MGFLSFYQQDWPKKDIMSVYKRCEKVKGYIVALDSLHLVAEKKRLIKPASTS